MKSFKLKLKKGYLGDFATEWWTEKDWEEHRKYVEELKASGEYGKEVEVTLNLKENPVFDMQPTHIHGVKCSESYKMIIIDMGL